MCFKNLIAATAVFLSLYTQAQTCYSISNRTNGNGNPGTCGSPNCSGAAKTGHLDVSFGASCPGVIPSMQLIAVTSGALPSPFCFDPGNCISPGTVRYCFRGNNLPSSGFMTLSLVQGATTWTCSYDVNGGSGTILPIKLSGFEVRLQSSAVQLNWTTDQEINNKEFQIERSNSDQPWALIGTIAGKGTTYSTEHYHFADEQPAKGISYYRLKQIDIDGRSTYSNVLKIDNRMKGLQLTQLYPNPATDIINLQLQSDEIADIDARFYDLSGRQVFLTHRKIVKGNQTWRINLPKIGTGVYEMILSDNNGGTLSEKILIN